MLSSTRNNTSIVPALACQSMIQSSAEGQDNMQSYRSSDFAFGTGFGIPSPPQTSEDIRNSFRDRYNIQQKDWDRSRTSMDDLMRDLVEYNNVLFNKNRDLEHENQKLKQVEHDLGEAIHTSSLERFEYTRWIQHLNSQMAAHKEKESPYVIALIDGNELFFNDSLVKQGKDGGRKAAETLLESMQSQYETESPNTDIPRFAATIYANILGMSHAMAKSGIVEDVETVSEFAGGFNTTFLSGDVQFDLVDCGQGQNVVTSKMLAAAQFHLQQSNCRNIMLGSAQDPRSSLIIQTQEQNEAILQFEDRDLLTELEKTSIEILPVSRESTKPLTDTLALRPALQPASSSSWADITSGPPPHSTIPLKATNEARKPSPQLSAPHRQSWSPGPRGCDPPLAVNSTTLNKVKGRAADEKLCNNHYIRGHCGKGSACMFIHDHVISDGEMTALRFLARATPCQKGQDCDLEDCIYGHNCPIAGEHGDVCETWVCRFKPHEHPPWTKIVCLRDRQ
ncbi:CCCH zinc finger dna binding protein [Phlyctema vagabunda]|uniref:CCCH zinc finger dna binding protein n=1 Tax=Phlyctema vagabunda TaxID=108571 RepID=A0ABR4PLB9_9HELO